MQYFATGEKIYSFQYTSFSQVDSGKQSAFKFLRVLEGLRDWEVCSPDISAAVEFCREKIVEMPVDEYEEWFQQQFPKVCAFYKIFTKLQ